MYSLTLTSLKRKHGSVTVHKLSTFTPQYPKIGYYIEVEGIESNLTFFLDLVKPDLPLPHSKLNEVLCPHYLKEFWTGHKPIVIH